MSKLIPILSFIASLILGLIAVPDAITTIQIAQRAPQFTSTRATLLQHHTKKHGSGPETQEVTFKYRVGDREYKGDNYWTRTSDTEDEIKASIRKEKSGIKTILVYYAPKHPELAVIRSDVNILMPVFIIALTVFLFIAGLLSVRGQRKRRQLLERDFKRRNTTKPPGA